MSKIIKSTQARASDFRTIESIKLPVFKEIHEPLPLEKVASPEELIEKAHKQQAEIIQKAKEDAIQMEKESQERGFQEGYQQGLEAARSEFEKMEMMFTQRFHQLEEEFSVQQRLLLEEASKDVREIVLYITEKLVGDLIKEKDDLVVDLYKMLQSLITDKEINEIKVNTKDYQFMYDYFSFTKKDLQTKLIQSDEIHEGTICIETEQGHIMKNLRMEFEELAFELRRNYG